MIKQIPSQKIEEYLKQNPKCVLVDVRTSEEWEDDGKPDGEKLGLKTYFVTVEDKEFFIEDFKKLSISQDYEVLSICKSGTRSQFVADLLYKENYNCVNISDGFDGWASSGLPVKK